MGAYKQPWFHQILRFQNLTASGHAFDQADFDQTIALLPKLKPETAYKYIQQQAVHNTIELAKQYNEQSINTGILWTGTTTRGLMQLTDWKPASTAIGRRMRSELAKPVLDRHGSE